MRRSFALVAAAAMLLTLLPATALAGAPIRERESAVALFCEAPTDRGFVFLDVQISEQSGAYGDLAYWGPGADPFVDQPTLIAADSDVTGDATGMSATFDLVEFDETVEPPFGDPAGIATLEATFTPDGPPEPIAETDRFGNLKERVTGTAQGLLPEGSLALPNGDTLDVAPCFAVDRNLTFFWTNPSAFSAHSSHFFVSCFWEDEGSEILLFATTDAFGLFGDIYIVSPDGEFDSVVDTTLTRRRLSMTGAMVDAETGDEVGSASASAALAATRDRTRIVEDIGPEVRKVTTLRYTVDGELELTLGGTTATYPMDGEHCESADQREMFHGVRPAGPRPRPLANDTPDGAIALRLGQRARAVTGGNAPGAEVPCTFEVEEEPDPIEVLLGYTVWYTVRGTGREMTASSAGSNFDTVLGVYTRDGDEFEGVACVDDVFDPSFSLNARASWDSEAGVTYWIQVGGFDGQSGRLQVVVH